MSWHDDLVARLHQDILLHLLALGDLAVVELQPFGAAQNDDFLGVGEIAKAARIDQRLQYRGIDDQRERTRSQQGGFFPALTSASNTVVSMTSGKEPALLTSPWM